MFPLLNFFREKFLLGKKCRFHCSWKVVALALTAVTLVLSTVIAYFGGKLSLYAKSIIGCLGELGLIRVGVALLVYPTPT